MHNTATITSWAQHPLIVLFLLFCAGLIIYAIVSQQVKNARKRKEASGEKRKLTSKEKLEIVRKANDKTIAITTIVLVADVIIGLAGTLLYATNHPDSAFVTKLPAFRFFTNVIYACIAILAINLIVGYIISRMKKAIEKKEADQKERDWIESLKDVPAEIEKLDTSDWPNLAKKRYERLARLHKDHYEFIDHMRKLLDKNSAKDDFGKDYLITKSAVQTATTYIESYRSEVQEHAKRAVQHREHAFGIVQELAEALTAARSIAMGALKDGFLFNEELRDIIEQRIMVEKWQFDLWQHHLNGGASDAEVVEHIIDRYEDISNDVERTVEDILDAMQHYHLIEDHTDLQLAIVDDIRERSRKLLPALGTIRSKKMTDPTPYASQRLQELLQKFPNESDLDRIERRFVQAKEDSQTKTMEDVKKAFKDFDAASDELVILDQTLRELELLSKLCKEGTGQDGTKDTTTTDTAPAQG
jgi:hypothetical protein